MEEEKKNPQNQGAQGQGGRSRRRRHRHHKGHGGAPQNNQNAPVPQQVQGGQNNAQKGQAQPQKGQNAQGNPQKGQQRPEGKSQPKQTQQGKGQSQPQKAQNQPQKGQPPKKKEERKPQNANQADNRKDTYVYILDGNLYINLTNKCCNGCDFCVRNERSSYYGNYLWLRHGEPTAAQVIAALNGLGDLTRFKEGVFCGFGEPTYRMAEMVAVCDFLHEKGLKTRLNTNGQGNLVNKRDIVPEMKGKIDFVNVSLNASCAEKYQPMCRSQFGAAGFEGLIEFAKLCKKNDIPCRFSIVDCIGEEEVEACKRLAQSVSIPLHIRKYIQDS